MPRTLRDLKDEADRRLAAGNTLDALKILRLVLEGVPLDFELRLEIGDVVAGMGRKDLAAAIFEAVAEHDVRSGSPLRAMAALKRLEALGVNATAGISLLTETYASGSSNLGRGIKPAPADYDTAVRDDLEIEFAIDQKEFLPETARMAAFTDNIENYPDVVPPVQIFSTLSRIGFTELFSRLTLKRFGPGEHVIRQGTPGDAVYFIARGEVGIVRTTLGEKDEPVSTQLALLGPGSLFGEMALVSSDPRSASVVSATPVDVLELTRSDVEQVSAKVPPIAGAMARFTQERMIANLMATNPLFEPFDEESKKQLLARFTGHEVPKETIFLEQGNAGNGLYVILRGAAEVLKWEKDEYVPVATLCPGDVAGEISLLYEEPVSATVRTTTSATLLFLARELFKPLVDSVPELLAHFNRLAEERLRDTEFKMMQKSVVDDDFIEEIDEEAEISDDDLVFI